MKIMHIVCSPASGGAEVYVKDLSAEMALKGHEVFIVFLDRASESGRDKVFEAEFLSELEVLGVGYGFLGRRCRRNFLKGIWRLLKFKRLFQPDVINSHLYYGAFFSLFMLGVPHIYTHHNIKLKASSLLYKLLDVRTSAYVGICQACESLLGGVSRRKVVKIDNGVSLKRILPKESYHSGSPVKMVCVGTLSEQKNHRLLLGALATLSDLEFHLTVAGEGSLKAELEQLSDRLGISDRVDFIGNSNNIKQLLHDADLFMMSSSWEGLPIAQIEATLTGLPVIVTDVGGCAEIVKNVGNGLVAKVEVDDYAEKLRRLIVDENFRIECYKDALAKSSLYSIDNSVCRHLELYSSFLPGFRTPV